MGITRAGGHVLTDKGWVLDTGETEAAEVEAPDVDPVDEFHTGGGWYQIGDEKVQGKEAARAALEG
jgi:hypothetical protein